MQEKSSYSIRKLTNINLGLVGFFLDLSPSIQDIGNSVTLLPLTLHYS